ncbi:hypothetical protein L2E82_31967 [Cichorium intybus]|uniref:Uncharacterized protein n=1 Tax=Cichorium intybus TaxID=13427 RepID=A0ACB9BG95_CICIN|nr:hypothetical protein L2E82_31967 [Cichorium intybus]
MPIFKTGSTQVHSLVQHRFTALRDQHPLPTPRTPSPVTLNLAHSQKRRCDLVDDGKRIAYNGPLTFMKTRSKTKATAMPVYPIHLEKTKNKRKGIPIPHSTSHNDLSKKYEGTMVATPVNYEVNGAEDLLKSKSAKVALPTNKKRNLSSKGSSKKFVLPQEFIDQQRAYFKEIDEYELEVEEADQVSI